VRFIGTFVDPLDIAAAGEADIGMVSRLHVWVRTVPSAGGMMIFFDRSLRRALLALPVSSTAMVGCLQSAQGLLPQ
jgi:hypothetical protein